MWQLGAALDPELGVGAREVALDGLERHIQLSGDFSVGPALGRELRDAELAGGQGFHAGAPRAPRARSGSLELAPRPGGQRPGAAAGGELKRPGKRVPGRRALTGPPQGRPKFRERVGALEQRWRVIKHGDRFPQQCKPFLPALCQPGGPQGDPERTRRAEHPHVGEFGICQLTRALALAKAQQCEHLA